MRFKPMSEREANDARSSLLPDGRYDAVVRKAEHSTSKSGNDMIKLELDVFHDTGKSVIFDYLLSTDKMIWKLRHFCESGGLMKQYDSGDLRAEDCEGVNVCVELVAEESKDPKYPPRSQVKDYMESAFAAKPRTQAAAPAKSPPPDDDDGSIPF